MLPNSTLFSTRLIPPGVSALGWALGLAVLLLPHGVMAGSGELAVSSSIQYSTVIQGAVDPVTAEIYNTAPAGSDPVGFSVYASFPYGNSGTYFGSKDADGGTGYLTLPFAFNSGSANPGANKVSVTATDIGTGQSLTQSGTVQVLAHGVPAFVFGGNLVQLASQPPAAREPSVQPLAFGATGGGETFAAGSTAVNDPIAPTAEMDLDSISVSGSPQISITLQPFVDEVASDDPALGMAFDIDIDGSTPGHYFTVFELNYSDEQDLPGADAPGSEHRYFAVEADVTESGVTGGLVVPEPGVCSLLLAGGLLLSTRRGQPE